MLNWIKRTMLTSTCAAYNGGKLHPIRRKIVKQKNIML